MDEGLERRLAANQAVFREVNESIERGQWPGEGQRQVGFRCECARLGCNLLLELRIEEYERVRGNPRWFVVAPGHQSSEVESVIEDHAGYLVVEKQDTAGRVAEDTDPRD